MSVIFLLQLTYYLRLVANSEQKRTKTDNFMKKIKERCKIIGHTL